MSTIKDAHVLITGGAGGIGRLMAVKSLQAGARSVTVWDVDTAAMQQLSEAMTEAGHTLHTYRVDLSDTDEIYEAAELVLEEVGTVDILINNAGVVTGKLFYEHSRNEIERSIDINISGVMQTTRAFLVPMIGQMTGHIVNISSAASLMANPKMSVYAGSKWAVTGWSESLRLELESISPELRVTTVQPGYIKTGMFAGVKAPLLTPLLEPDDIADAIIEAIRTNRKVLRKPFMVKLTPFLKGILPAAVFDFLADKIFGVYSSMQSFTGRNSHSQNPHHEKH